MGPGGREPQLIVAADLRRRGAQGGIGSVVFPWEAGVLPVGQELPIQVASEVGKALLLPGLQKRSMGV